MAGCSWKQRACPPLCTLLCSLAFLLGPACFCQKEVPPGHLLFSVSPPVRVSHELCVNQ